MPWTRRDLLALFVLAILVLSLVGPALVGVADLPPGDFIDQFYAFAHFAAGELAQGRLPLWNPYTYSGHPFLADIQSGVFYPPNLVMLLLAALAGGELPLRAMYVQVALHLFLAGAFTYGLGRRLFQDRWAALLAALAFALGGYLTSYPVLQLAVLQTDAWLPTLLWLLDRELAQRQPSSILDPRSSILWLGLVWAMLLLPGHPQSVMYIGYTALAWGVYRAWVHGIGWWRGGVLVGLSALWGLGLAAVQYLPSIEYMRLSVRAAASYDRLAHGFPFRDLVGLFVPGLVSLWSPLYVGLIPLLFAIVALVRGSGQSGVKFWAGLGLVTLLLSFGGGLFVYALFYLLVPGFNLFQSQERAAFLVSFSLALLAGYGWIESRRQKAEGGSAKQSSGLGWLSALSPQQSAISYQLSVIGYRWWAFALVALTAMDLWRVAAPLLIGPPLPPDLGYPPALVQPAQALPRPARIENEYRLPANWGVLAEVEDTWGASPLRLQRYADFYAQIPPERRRRLLNVGLFLTWHGDVPGMTEVARLPVMHPVTGAPETTYVLQTEPGPRAWFVPDYAVVDDRTALARLADLAFDPWRVGLVAEDTPHPPSPSPTRGEGMAVPPSPPGGRRGEGDEGSGVKVLDHAPGVFTVEVDAPRDGLLMLSEVWYPGWRATLDDATAPLLRAHLTLLAVPVAAGQHRVAVRFDPPIVKRGLVITGTMLFLTVLGLGWGWTRRPGGGR